jgi:hypothetical protein
MPLWISPVSARTGLAFVRIPGKLLRSKAGCKDAIVRFAAALFLAVEIFGTILVLALAGFAATGSHRNAAICDTADCPASECP